MRWSIFCRVVDNFGDIGFAWRLAADLAGRGETVCLAIDDPSALAWLAPTGTAGVTVVDWDDAAAPRGEVLVETFGCGFPAQVDAGPGAAPPLAVRINVEHLSAESFVERSHGLPSPHFTPRGDPWPIWFFYPGFGERTGGLLREPGLLERRRAFGHGSAWLAARGIERRAGERCVSLFCYRNPALDALLEALSAQATLLLLTPGPATEQALALLGPGLRRGGLRAVRLPALAQPDFDRMLWSCELNLVRGEDSLVRALWSGAPFLWQAYPQEDAAQHRKIAAFLDRFLADAPTPLAGQLRALFAAWNATGHGAAASAVSSLAWPDDAAWAALCRRFRDRLGAQRDLAASLLEFAVSER
ncbi:MAG: elongation factor P maturation arginine rhamnosyltransferase EarP [Caldimonas sp.]